MSLTSHIDLEALAELADSPGELAGYGPVVADIARQVAAEHVDSEWRYTVHHPDNGQVVANGTTTKRFPTKAQARYVQARANT